MIKLGTVTDNQDPEQLRRVQVTTVDRGVSSSQWLSRVTNFDGDDLPLPLIGTTVVLAEVSGDSTEEVILGVLQTATTNNPIRDKDDKIGDWWSLLTSITFWVNRTFSVKSPSQNKPEIHLDQDGTIKASNILGSITLSPTGYIIVTNPTSTITMNNSGLNLVTPGSISITAANLTWNGQTLSRVGGTDTRGDVNLS
jgi:phage baseplate assembly protein gpV